MNILSSLSIYAIPCIIVIVSLLILFCDKELFNKFVSGAKEGLDISFSLLPTLVILLTAVSMFTASGALDFLCAIFEKPLKAIGIPKEMLPLIITRPISGSASTATITNLFETAGPDSFAGKASSILLGCTDTIFYTYSMYFTCCGIKKTRHAILCAIIAEAFCIALSCLITKLYF